MFELEAMRYIILSVLVKISFDEGRGGAEIRFSMLDDMRAWQITCFLDN